MFSFDVTVQNLSTELKLTSPFTLKCCSKIPTFTVTFLCVCVCVCVFFPVSRVNTVYDMFASSAVIVHSLNA